MRVPAKRRVAPGEVDLDQLPPAGRRILAAASDLFYRHGIGAVGVDEIAAQAGTTKKTIYDRFGSKEGLVTAYLQQRCRTWDDYLAAWLDAAAGSATERVLEPLRALIAWMVENDRGCAFVNAYAELAGTGHSGLAVIADEKRRMREVYAGLIAAAGLDAVSERATRMSLVHEGLIQQVAAGQHTDAPAQAIELARLVVSA